MTRALFVLLFLAAGAARADAGCSSDALARDAAPLAATRARLAGADIREDFETDVPEGSRADLDLLKDQLANLVASVVECAPPGTATADVERTLAGLAPRGHDENEGATTARYAVGIDFTAQTSGNLLTVLTTFLIPCGSDSALAVFEPVDGRWRERLRWHSPSYEQISGAFGALQFRVSPPDADGQWFVATAHMKPWCSSTWSMIGFELLRPGATPARPRVLLAESRSMWFGGDDFGTLDARRDALEVRWTASSIDTGVHSRPHVRHYAVRGDAVERTPPVALSPRDFVDEWLVSGWDEASKWTEPRAAPRLASVHAKLTEPHHTVEFGTRRRCGAHEFEIEATPEDAEPLYFRVRGKSDDFVLLDVGAKPRKDCVEETDEEPAP